MPKQPRTLTTKEILEQPGVASVADLAIDCCTECEQEVERLREALKELEALTNHLRAEASKAQLTSGTIFRLTDPIMDLLFKHRTAMEKSDVCP